MTYQQYLRSEHWKLLRGARLQLFPKCERCGACDELEVHHTVYRKTWFETKVGDLKTLCHGCHTRHHAVEHDPEGRRKLAQLEASAYSPHLPEYVDPNKERVKQIRKLKYGF